MHEAQTVNVVLCMWWLNATRHNRTLNQTKRRLSSYTWETLAPFVALRGFHRCITTESPLKTSLFRIPTSELSWEVLYSLHIFHVISIQMKTRNLSYALRLDVKNEFYELKADYLQDSILSYISELKTVISSSPRYRNHGCVWKECRICSKNTRVWARLRSHPPSNTYSMTSCKIPLLNHNLCKPKSTMFVYYSHAEDCSFFKVNTKRYELTDFFSWGGVF